MTAREFLTKTFQLAKIIASNEALSASEASDGLVSLNELLDSWATEGLMIPNTVQEDFNLVAGTASYTIGASGVFNTPRPLRIEDASVVVDDLQYPLQIITSQEWADISDKTISGRPTKLYYEKTAPLATIRLYPVPNAVEELRLHSAKPFTALASLDAAMSFPPGYMRSLRYNLALDIAPEYGQELPAQVQQVAFESKADLKRQNFQPLLLTSDFVVKKHFDINSGEQMKFPGFIGQSYHLANVNVDAQRLINWFPELVESGSGKSESYFKMTPGLTQLFEVGSGPIRCIHFDGLEEDDGSYSQLNRVFVVSGSEVFRFQYDQTSGWNYTNLGTLGTSEGPVSAASSTEDYGVTVFVDGSDDNYVYHKTGVSTETFSTFTAHSPALAPVERATKVIQLDGYFIYIVENSNDFYVSEWNSLAVSPLSFASAEGSPDTIVSIISNNRDLWLMNKRSCEIYQNVGNADFPFERAGGGFIENGCLAAESVAKISGTVLWLGRDAFGQGIINAATGPNHIRISTHAIEQEISTYADPSTATAYCYQDGGHQFYVINFDEATWVYDLTVKAWHQRAAFSDGAFGRSRAHCHAYFPDLKMHLVGDYENGLLYKFDNSVYTENGGTIKRLRAFPHISKDLDWGIFNKLQIDCKTGVGLDGAITQLGYDPQLMLRWSDDGGHTWSNEMTVSLGTLGNRQTRAIFRRLGKSRDRVFEISISDPVHCEPIAAYIEAM